MNEEEAFFLGVNFGKSTPNIQIVGLAAPVRHAFQALAALSVHPELCLGAGALARRCGLGGAALAKSLQNLARLGLLESQRGPRGGYRLARPPQKVTLVEVAIALGAGGERHGRCLLDDRTCREEVPCLLHSAATRADEQLARALRKLTLADLAAGTRQPAGRKRRPKEVVRLLDGISPFLCTSVPRPKDRGRRIWEEHP